MSNATLKDVAKEAGVSLSTVSLVLNGKGTISDDVRKRVYEAAKQLDYIKPVHASSIATKHISHIALLVCEDYEKAFEWNFIRLMIMNLEFEITKEQYYPVIIPVRTDQETNDVLEKIVLSKAGAVLSVHYGNSELFQQLESQGVPVVIVNNSTYQDQFFTVCADSFQGMYKATRHLIDLGHTDIAFVEYHRPDMPVLINDRFFGYQKALDEALIPFPENYRVSIDLADMDKLREELLALLQESNPPTALVAHDDHLAARIVVTLQQHNIRIPEDVSLIAPGDTLDYNQPYVPQITTWRLNNELVGQLAGEMILRRLKNDRKEIEVIKVNHRFIERGSCKPR